VSLLLGIILFVSLTACGASERPVAGSADTEVSEPTPAVSEAVEAGESAEVGEEEVEEEVEEDVENPVPDDWGELSSVTYDDWKAYIRFPERSALYRFGTYGYGDDQDTEAWVLFDIPDVESFDVFASVEDVLPNSTDQLIAAIKQHKANRKYDNYTVELTTQEPITINHFQMCKYTGVCVYEDWSTGYKALVEQQFVAYSAQVSGYEGYVYWVLLDESDDQSLADWLSENGEKMAWTLEVYPE
jgi:hypothetical protein